MADTLPAGAYLIGDPCYFLDDQNSDFWKSLFKTCPFFSDHVEGVHTIVDYAGTAHECALFGTGGDGGFEDLEGMFEYGVDSGSLGAFPVQFIMPPSDLTIGMGLRWCNQVYFDKPFHVGHAPGVITFGSIHIPVYT